MSAGAASGRGITSNTSFPVAAVDRSEIDGNNEKEFKAKTVEKKIVEEEWSSTQPSREDDGLAEKVCKDKKMLSGKKPRSNLVTAMCNGPPRTVLLEMPCEGLVPTYITKVSAEGKQTKLTFRGSHLWWEVEGVSQSYLKTSC